MFSQNMEKPSVTTKIIFCIISDFVFNLTQKQFRTEQLYLYYFPLLTVVYKCKKYTLTCNTEN